MKYKKIIIIILIISIVFIPISINSQVKNIREEFQNRLKSELKIDKEMTLKESIIRNILLSTNFGLSLFFLASITAVWGYIMSGGTVAVFLGDHTTDTKTSFMLLIVSLSCLLSTITTVILSIYTLSKYIWLFFSEIKN